jgi:hypothetical protein
MRLCGLALCALVVLSTMAAADEAGLSASRGELSLRLDDGRVLRGRGLEGATLLIRQGESMRSIGVDRVDVGGAGGSPVPLYTLSVAGSSASERRPLCRPDVLGRRAAIAIDEPDGRIRFSCSSGAEGKCALLGYVPWEPVPTRAGPYSMRDLHRACVHLIRADYGGDGRPATQDGTLVHTYDRFGIRPYQAGTGMTFEAAWSPDGAVCVARTRHARLSSLSDLVRRYPRLAGRTGPRRCNEALMRQRPEALLFNLSRAGGDPRHRRAGQRLEQARRVHGRS